MPPFSMKSPQIPRKRHLLRRLWGVLWGCYFTMERKAFLVANHLRLDFEGDRWPSGKGQQNSPIGTFRLLAPEDWYMMLPEVLI
jgi:hypothetical protein